MNADIIKCVVCGEDVDYDLSIRIKDPAGDACRECADGMRVAEFLISKIWGKNSKPLKNDRKK